MLKSGKTTKKNPIECVSECVNSSVDLFSLVQSKLRNVKSICQTAAIVKRHHHTSNNVFTMEIQLEYWNKYSIAFLSVCSNLFFTFFLLSVYDNIF